VDDYGNKSCVLVPIENWNNINKKYNALLKKVQVLTGIERSLEEIDLAKKTGKKLMTLKEFLCKSNR